MKSKFTACSGVMFLLSLLWTLPASAQSFETGVWYSPTPIGGSVWLAFFGTEFVSVRTTSIFACSGGMLVGYAKPYDVMGDFVSGTSKVRCKGASKFTVDFELTYDSGGDTLTGAFLLFRRVNNADPATFIDIVKKWKTNTLTEWDFFGLVMKPPPVLPALPGRGADCTDPPNLGPGADLTNCDLAGTDLTGIDLSGAILNLADLSSANLSFADLGSANLTNANLTNANLFAVDLRKANLSSANLGSADLTGASLDEANLFAANLTNADLTNAFLISADLGSAILTNADLTNANLFGADLFGANLLGVIWFDTACPDGTNSNDGDGDGFTCLNNLTPT